MPATPIAARASKGGSRERTCAAAEASSVGVGGSEVRKRSVTRTQPTSRLTDASGPPSEPTTSSVEPPPMSTSSVSSSGGLPAVTPRYISAASSSPSSRRVVNP